MRAMQISGRRDAQVLTRRVRIECALAGLTAAMALLTIAWPEWIEAIFSVDPDGGNGALEWAFVAASALASLTFSLLARADWAARAKVAGHEEVVHR
jgi:hypothetical protein